MESSYHHSHGEKRVLLPDAWFSTNISSSIVRSSLWSMNLIRPELITFPSSWNHPLVTSGESSKVKKRTMFSSCFGHFQRRNKTYTRHIWYAKVFNYRKQKSIVAILHELQQIIKQCLMSLQESIINKLCQTNKTN